MHKSLSDYFNRSYEMDFSALQDEMDAMAFEGDWQPLVRRIAAAYKENSSIRDSIRGEHNLQGFFKAYLALNPFYLVEPEIELKLHSGAEIREADGNRCGSRGQEPGGGRTAGTLQPRQGGEPPVRGHAAASCQGGVSGSGDKRDE